MPTNVRSFLIPLILAVALAVAGCERRPARAGSHDAGPRAAALAAIRAVDARDWDALVRLADPASLESRRAEHVDAERSIAGADQFPPGSRLARSADSSHVERLRTLYGVTSMAELERLPAETVFVREVRFMYRLADEYPGAALKVTREVVGSVPEGDTVAHVVVRVRPVSARRGDAPSPAREWMEVITVFRRGEQWRAEPNTTLTGPPFDMINAVQ